MSKRKKKPAARLTAANADKYVLYQMSVQEPEHEVDFFDQAYYDAFKRKPKVLREDFCGTFAVCCEWVKKRGRVAVGVDLDAEPLEWGKAHNLSQLTSAQQQRVTLMKDDVRKVHRNSHSRGSTTRRKNDATFASDGHGADVLAAQNFSFWCFKTRDAVREYFQAAYRNLADRGIMVMDMMGGAECMDENQEDVRRYRNGRTDFTYAWEQIRYDPITHDASFYIHFRFPDGTALERVFEYHWRFWTIPEVRELLAEAGFRKTHVYWEGTDDDGEGDDDWHRADNATPDPSWIAYIVAVK